MAHRVLEILHKDMIVSCLYAGSLRSSVGMHMCSACEVGSEGFVSYLRRPLFPFCSSSVLDQRVGHTMDVLPPFIPVLCHSDRLFHGESCPRLDVVHPGRACVVFLACVHLALFLALSLCPGHSPVCAELSTCAV